MSEQPDDRLTYQTTIIAARAYSEWSVEALCEHLMLMAATIADKANSKTSQILTAATAGAMVDEAQHGDSLTQAVNRLRDVETDGDA